jgi:predicted O-methyltransferase YrrM
MKQIQDPTSSNANVILRDIEAVPQSEFLPIIVPYKGKILAEEVPKAKPKPMLKASTLIGYSALLMGKEMLGGSEIVTIEIHREEAERASKKILEANIPTKVEISNGNGSDAIPTVQGTFDFAFIGAEKTEYYRYLMLVEEKLRKGAVVFANNAGLFATQMCDYLHCVHHSSNYKKCYIQVGEDDIEISVNFF